jgi:hypothetical protein
MRVAEKLDWKGLIPFAPPPPHAHRSMWKKKLRSRKADDFVELLTTNEKKPTHEIIFEIKKNLVKKPR